MSPQAASLSDSLAEEYFERGYLVVNDVLSHDEVREIEKDVWKIGTGGYNCPNIQPLSAALTEEQVKRRVLGIQEGHLVSPVFAKYVRHPVIAAMLTQLVGGHLRGWNGAVKCLQSMYYAKPPQMGGHPWHQDETFFPTRDRSLTAVYIAIDDLSTENGTLWFIPGSQRQGYLFPRSPHQQDSEYLFELGSSGFSAADMVPLEMRSGSIAFFNGYTLHRSTRNRSNRHRRVLVNHYCNAWSPAPRHIPAGTGRDRMGEEIALADDRKVMQVAGDDPYAWKGYDHAAQHVTMMTL